MICIKDGKKYYFTVMKVKILINNQNLQKFLIGVDQDQLDQPAIKVKSTTRHRDICVLS